MLVQIKSENVISMFGFLYFCEAPDWPVFFYIFLSFADELRFKDLKGPVDTNNRTVDQFPHERSTLFRPICVFLKTSLVLIDMCLGYNCCIGNQIKYLDRSNRHCLVCID